MSGLPVDRVDLEARRKAARIIYEKFSKIAESILQGEPPRLEIPKRTLGNVEYDPEKGILVMGSGYITREFLNMGEARRFMQTLLMAAIIYQALIENEYPTIRDLYYRGKHTIVYRDLRGKKRQENTWDQQSESDSVIRDIEVYTGLLREDMLILSKEKGKVVGRMRIRSGDDIIDLSRMGHGAYAIESTPDLIEFIDVDAEFVLVVEKDAVFQQLHRIKFWDKYKAILVTGAGQPDRATRRFVHRLHYELNLPVYILTDSIPGDETVILRDPVTGTITMEPIEEVLGPFFTPGAERERITIPVEALTWDPRDGRTKWAPVGYAYRHWIDGEILEIETEGRGTIRVTPGHSLFAFRNGRITVIPARDLQPGDHIIVTEKLPHPNDVVQQQVYLHPRENLEIELDEDTARFLGLFIADGNINQGKYLRLSMNPNSTTLIRFASNFIRDKLGLHPTIYRRSPEDRKEVQIIAYSKTMAQELLETGIGRKGKGRRIPQYLYTARRDVQLAFLRGLIEGDGHIDKYGNITISTRNPTLAKQVFTLLQLLGVNPRITIYKEDIHIRIGKSRNRTPPNIYKALTGSLSTGNQQLTTEPTYGLPITRELRKTLIRAMNYGKISFKPTQKTISKAKLMLLIQKGYKLPTPDYEKLVYGDAVTVRIKRIRKTRYKGYVYDLAIPQTNSFIGNFGIIYHNSDPYGWYIYSVFKVGSIQLSYESERLATPPARFLGVSMTDVFGYGRKKKPWLNERERRNFIIRANERDLQRARELMQYKWFQTPDWRRELMIFLRRKAKLEIEALASKGLRFLAYEYIPRKIETKDWIT